ncbi:MAG: CGGC domain-containing protein [Deltaproteobacteria bacterium]|nr:CGGC domain-containing protein [Deltaproteobacteria bacterium]
MEEKGNKEERSKTDISDMRKDRIYLSSCLVNPDCPYSDAEEMSKMIETKTGIKVEMGTHEYH